MSEKDASLAPHDPPNPEPVLNRLSVFVGKWNTEGLIKASPSGPAAKLKATDIYEWLPGGFFLFTTWMAIWGTKRLGPSKS